MDKQELIDFEQEIVDLYHECKIRSPVHLSGSVDGNLEEELIKIFKEVKPQDWIFTTYRSHYHALLKGMPKERLKQWILDNKSIHVMDKEHKIVSSAIVGGTLSQAVGVAMAIKIRQDKVREVINRDFAPMAEGDRKKHITNYSEFMRGEHVWVFCGDMTASLGMFGDCWNYAISNDLPITFVIEDNGLSTDTPTREAWGHNGIEFSDAESYSHQHNIRYIRYKRKYPHYGTGKRIDFSEDKT